MKITFKILAILFVFFGLPGMFIWGVLNDETNVQAQKVWTGEALEAEARLQFEKAEAKRHAERQRHLAEPVVETDSEGNLTSISF